MSDDDKTDRLGSIIEHRIQTLEIVGYLDEAIFVLVVAAALSYIGFSAWKIAGRPE